KLPEGAEVPTTLAAAQEQGLATLSYGSFITAVINFLIMAVIIFFMVKGINKLSTLGKKKEEEVPEEPTTKTCPFCKSEIAVDATKCPHCTSDIPEE
ncbi:MAG: MscL family protein, partial [Acutalibacteraceae bacterium]